MKLRHGRGSDLDQPTWGPARGFSNLTLKSSWNFWSTQCICFLLCQTNYCKISGPHKMRLWFCTSVGQKSDPGLTELRRRCQQGCTPLRGVGRGFFLDFYRSFSPPARPALRQLSELCLQSRFTQTLLSLLPLSRILGIQDNPIILRSTDESLKFYPQP